MNSSLGSLNFRDIGKGLVLCIIVAVLNIVLAAAQTALTGKPFIIDVPTLEATVAFTACGYLLKQLGTGSGGQLLNNDPPKS